jgi:hypothetical protein
VGGPEGSKETPKAVYRSDPEGGPDALSVGGPEGSEETPKAVYRSDPEGGPDVLKVFGAVMVPLVQ